MNIMIFKENLTNTIILNSNTIILNSNVKKCLHIDIFAPASSYTIFKCHCYLVLQVEPFLNLISK